MSKEFPNILSNILLQIPGGGHHNKLIGDFQNCHCEILRKYVKMEHGELIFRNVIPIAIRFWHPKCFQFFLVLFPISLDKV